MTTKAPSAVKPASDAAAEKIAYAAVEDIPTVEAHDRDRLGYCVWLWLSRRRDSLELAVRNAGARITISEEEALRRIREKLRQLGVTL
jgi:hypothetical protein